jgi:hypothetical protein
MVQYNEAVGKYQLFISKQVLLDLALFHKNGEPFKIVHHDPKLLEDLAQKIKQKHNRQYGTISQSVRFGKLWTTIYAAMLASAATGLLYRANISAFTQINTWLVTGVLGATSLFFVYKILSIYAAGGVGQKDIKETLMTLEFREWIKRYTSHG